MQLCKIKTDESQVTMAVRKEGKRRKGIEVRGEKKDSEKNPSLFLVKCYRSVLTAIVRIVEITRKIF